MPRNFFESNQVAAPKPEKPKGTSEKEGVADNTFSREDIDRWRSGAERFSDFKRKATGLSIYTKHEIALLQAMFLGEKPASHFVNKNRANEEILEELGFKVEGPIYYIPELVQKVIDENRDLFTEIEGCDINILIKKVNEGKFKNNELIEGILFGYPRKSAEDYNMIYNSELYKKSYDILLKLERILSRKDRKYLTDAFWGGRDTNLDREKLFNFIVEKILKHKKELDIDDEEINDLLDMIKKMVESVGVNVYNIVWREFKPSDESLEKQRRLKAAFEKSGILK